jgi:hypothetical protein
MTHVRAGAASVDFKYSRGPDTVNLEVKSSEPCTVAFSPALSLRTSVLGAEWNGKAIPFHVTPTSQDQHVEIKIPSTRSPGSLRLRLKNDFDVSYANELPPLGQASEALRILSESWSASRTELTMDVSGRPGKSYELFVRGAGQILTVDGGTLNRTNAGAGALKVSIPSASTQDFVEHKVVLHFAK